MIENKYTAKELLEIKGAGLFCIVLFIVTVIASVMQYLGGSELLTILKTTVAYLFVIIFGFIIYKRKKNKQKALLLSWIAGFFTVAIAIYAKYNYAFEVNWLYSVQGIHINAVGLISLIVLQFLYNKRLYLFFYIIVSIHWFVFLYIAYINGVDMGIVAIKDGAVSTGVNLLQQVYFFLILIIVGYVNYKNIPVIEDFDKMTLKQRMEIIERSNQNIAMAEEVRTKMRNLFSRLDEQNKELSIFNEKLQDQASTFEQISATIEELSSSSEKISEVAQQQVEGNSNMDYTMQEFFEIKDQTKNKLNSSLESIEVVVKRTNISNNILENVEKTILEIRGQSDKIAETITVIVDIADRINLLSLNASIEAARAGEHGRGFAVVADEIGKLASQTGDSIKEIETVLYQSTQKTKSGVEIINEASENIKKLIDEMLKSSEKIDDLRDNIFLEEKFLKGIDKQMKMNVDVAKTTGVGTEEQKAALESVAEALESLNEELTRMAEAINIIALTSQIISEDAKILLEKAEKSLTKDTTN